MKEVNILYLEDSVQDAELAGRILQKAGINYHFKLVDTRDEFEQALQENNFDIILADHSLFQFNSSEALRIFRNTGIRIPFILVTGTVSEEFAVRILQEGADDYLLKSNLARLPNAILTSLEKYRLEREKKKYLDDIVSNATLMKEAEGLAGFGSWEANIISGEIKWSEGMYSIFGYDPGEVKPGHDILLHHIHAEDRAAYQHVIYSYLQKQDSYASIMRIRDKKGQDKFLTYKIVVYHNSEQQPVRLVGFMQNITEKKKLEKELAEQALRQQKLITEVTIQAQEKERHELGRELHDNINQVLASIKMFLGILAESTNKRDDVLTLCRTHIDYAIEEIRKLSRSLVAPSLGNISLFEALQELADEIHLANLFRIKLVAELGQDYKFSKKMELMLYRIAQEQLTNIRKYAHASEVVISIAIREDQLHFSISDNGIGFDTMKKAQGIGLKNIKGRVDFYGGKIEIISAPGQGCTLRIIIPLQ